VAKKLTARAKDNSHLSELNSLLANPGYSQFLHSLSTLQPNQEFREKPKTSKLGHSNLFPFYLILKEFYKHEGNRNVIFTTTHLPPARRGLRDSTIRTTLFTAKRTYFPTAGPIRVENPARGFHRVLSGNVPRARQSNKEPFLSYRCEGKKDELELYLSLLSLGTRGRVEFTSPDPKIIQSLESGFRPLPPQCSLEQENGVWILRSN
jgi:hypothetical protein